MIQDEILQQQAAKLNLTASDEDVNAKLTEIKAPYTEDQFNNLLKQRNLSLDDFKRDIRRGLTRDQTDEQRDRVEDQHHRRADRRFLCGAQGGLRLIEPQYHLAQIVVTTAARPQQGNLQTAKPIERGRREEEDRCRAQPARKRRRFRDRRSAFSEDPNTASNGGDMGFVPESQLQDRSRSL